MEVLIFIVLFISVIVLVPIWRLMNSMYKEFDARPEYDIIPHTHGRWCLRKKRIYHGMCGMIEIAYYDTIEQAEADMLHLMGK